MKVTVTLGKKTITANGKKYEYWVIRWFSSDGKRLSKSLGKTNKMSSRQARKRRDEKQRELDDNPGRRDAGPAPSLKKFLDDYKEARKRELAKGTLLLHSQTTRYLLGFFGEHRKLDTITRPEARRFKTALANGDLAHVNKRKREKLLAMTTVDENIRNAKTIFNHAMDDDWIKFNPFDRLCENAEVDKEWHYVSAAEFAKLMAVAKPAWKLLFALARWAGLRLEEALELPVRHIDWTTRRLTVISRDDSAAEGEFTVKDKDRRVVPISQELFAFLKQYLDPASELVVPRGGVLYKNVWRDFQVIAKRADIVSYHKPIHSLRKSCITDWAKSHPTHVVMVWAGHADIRTTQKYYLQVQESDYEKAAGLSTTSEPDPVVQEAADRLEADKAEAGILHIAS